MIHREALRVGIIAIALAVVTVLSGAAQATEESIVRVEVIGRAYQPVDETVGLGQTVVWQNESLTHHTVTSTTGTFDSGSIAPGESYSLTFTHPGTFEYKCTIHPTMKGTVIVLDLAPGTLQLRLSARHAKRGADVIAHVRAARSGDVLLQGRSGGTWQTVAHGMLDAKGEATLSLSDPAHRALRVVLPAENGQPRQLGIAERSPV